MLKNYVLLSKFPQIKLIAKVDCLKIPRKKICHSSSRF